MEDEILLKEKLRIAELLSYQILDTPSEKEYDDITELASEICETPMAMVSLIDDDRQWFKSKVGLEADALPRASAFCSHAILQPNEIFLVENAPDDARFAANPLVTGEPHIRFYAGAPLTTESGEALGTLCVVDDKPRQLTEKQKFALSVLARQVVAQLELRRTILQMQHVEAQRKESEERFKAFMNNSPAVAYMKDEAGRLVYTNKVFERQFNIEENGLLGKTDFDYLPDDVAAVARKNDALVLSKWEPAEIIENVPTPDGSASHWLSLKFPFLDGRGRKFVGGVSLDITARTLAEEKLNESERRYRHLFELSPGFINVHGLDGVITSVNEAAANALGYQPAEIVGKSLADFLIPAARRFFKDYLQRMSKSDLEEGIFYLLSKTGEVRIWQYRNRLFKEGGAADYVLGCAQDVTDLQRVQEELRSLTLTDDLTSLYNRRGFFALAGQALRYARRTNKNCILIYADLDNLKLVNDRFGHETGSQMIVDASTVFRSFFRDSDIAARLGGDEFVILVQDISEAGTEVIKDRLQAKIEDLNLKNSRSYSLSISFGIARFDPKSAMSIEELVAEADRLMYLQKQLKKSSTADRQAVPTPDEKLGGGKNLV
ncbi:MAG: diguanylate cyclase [Pyrinomonadaceae bacterium]|nr:diguanylate cyclase [Pyrinomonadaceae bacterium]